MPGPQRYPQGLPPILAYWQEQLGKQISNPFKGVNDLDQAAQDEMNGVKPALPNLPPRPTPDIQQFPQPSPIPSYDELERSNPDMGSKANEYQVPSGWGDDKTLTGTMSLGGLNLHGAGSGPLAGLKAAGSQIPELARINNAFDIRSTGRPEDMRYGADIMGDVENGLQPQKALQAKVDDALITNHPAISAGEESEARRKSYPAEAAAQGNIMASLIGSKGRITASENQMHGQQARAGALASQSVLRGLIDAMQDRTTDANDPQAKQKRMATWLALLSQLQSGGLVPELNDDDFDSDTTP